MSRRLRPATAWIAIIALLFAQLATAAYACPQLVGAAPVVVDAPSPDCDHEANAMPNLCESHCDYGNASLDSPKPAALPPIAFDCVRVIALVPASEPPRAEPRARIATGPPSTRFTVLRI